MAKFELSMLDENGMLDEDTFDDVFKPLTNPKTEAMPFTFAEAKAYAAEHGVEYIWTLVDGDDSNVYAATGFHIVNNFGDYLITTEPWVDAIGCATYMTYEPDDDEAGVEAH